MKFHCFAFESSYFSDLEVYQILSVLRWVAHICQSMNRIISRGTIYISRPHLSTEMRRELLSYFAMRQRQKHTVQIFKRYKNDLLRSVRWNAQSARINPPLAEGGGGTQPPPPPLAIFNNFKTRENIDKKLTMPYSESILSPSRKIFAKSVETFLRK